MVSKFFSSILGRTMREKEKPRDLEKLNKSEGDEKVCRETKPRQRPFSEYIPSPRKEYQEYDATSWLLANHLTPPPSASLLPSTHTCLHSDEEGERRPETSTSFEEEMQVKTAFALSWDVQFLGSFPISNTHPEHVSYRLEKFSPLPPFKGVQLSVSLMGVRVANEEGVLMSHSLRRICSVVGRSSLRQVAYIALEPSGQTYRRQCHVFQTEDVHQVEEIESVLGNAFQAALVARHSTQSICKLPPIQATDIAESTTARMPLNEKRMSSTAFLSRLLGKGKENNTNDDPKMKRRRRPVSAVFSSAIHRLSSSTSMTGKRMSTAELPRKDPVKKAPEIPRALISTPLRISPPLAEQEDSSSNQSTQRSSIIVEKSPVLVFDEKIGEWIYPVDELLEQQLEKVAYFCKLPSRETLHRNLQAQPEGAFVLRYSESKRRCLALSVRVPLSHNRNGISHYLVVRNEKGFRIKQQGCVKHFPSIQMLITHHSVMQEQLPCRLLFVQWTKNDWRDQRELRETRDERREQLVHETIVEERSQRNSKVFPEGDENRNTCFYDENLMKKLQQIETPKRRSRHFDQRRQSRFVDWERI